MFIYFWVVFFKKGTVSTRLKRMCFYSTFRERVYKVLWGHFYSFRIELQFCFGRISFRRLKTSHIGFYSSTTQLSSFMMSIFLFFSVPSACLICNDPYMLLEKVTEVTFTSPGHLFLAADLWRWGWREMCFLSEQVHPSQTRGIMVLPQSLMNDRD